MIQWKRCSIVTRGREDYENSKKASQMEDLALEQESADRARRVGVLVEAGNPFLLQTGFHFLGLRSRTPQASLLVRKNRASQRFAGADWIYQLPQERKEIARPDFGLYQKHGRV